MRRLILYSLAAHLVVLGLVLTVPLVAEKKVKPREVYRVNFVELPGSIPEKKRVTEPPVAKKQESKRESPVPEKKEEPKKEPSPPEKKEVTPEELTEKKKKPPKAEKIVEKQPPAAPSPVKETEAKEKPQPEQKPEPRSIEAEKAAPVEKDRGKKEEKSKPPQIEGVGSREKGAIPPAEETTATASMGPRGVSKLSLEEVDFPYSYYLAVMQRKIAEHWNPVYGEFERRGGRRVVVFFRVLRGGDIVDLRVEKSSGSDFLDRSAAMAIMKANPLPPLPHEFEGEELRVHFGFEYSGEG